MTKEQDKAALRIDLRGEICKIISAMLDGPREHGIYQTTKCFDALEELYHRLLAWQRERAEPVATITSLLNHPLGGYVYTIFDGGGHNLQVGDDLYAAPTAQDALDARLPYIVEYMRKDGGHGWIPMAAFDQQRIAENYAQSCRGDNIPWEYRVVDAAIRGKEEG